MAIKFSWDGGHGLGTAGKRTPDDEREWTFNNIIGMAFADELSKYDGIVLKRFDDPTGKRDIPLKERTDAINAWGSNYHISFHHNANTSKWGNWTGVETFTYTNALIESRKLAMAVHPALVEGYGLKDRGIKAADLHMVRETKCPAILVEGGFMDSTIDIKALRNKAKLQNAGRLIARAVAKHLKLKLKQVPKVENKSSVVKSMVEIARDTMRKEATKEIKAAVKDGRFTSKHENVEKYSDAELQHFMLVALARRK